MIHPLLSVVIGFASLLPAQDLQQDSLPLSGKTRPVPIGTPPVSPIPQQVDTFYPTQRDTAKLRTDPVQQDDRDPGKQPGLFRDTIPK